MGALRNPNPNRIEAYSQKSFNPLRTSVLSVVYNFWEAGMLIFTSKPVRSLVIDFLP